jgi:hypothetical protein
MSLAAGVQANTTWILSFPLYQSLRLEIGPDLSPAWGLMTGGLRLSHHSRRPADSDPLRLGTGGAVDLEAGGGIGLGGVERDTPTRGLAGGVYGGAGAAWFFGSDVGVFGRGRVHLSRAAGIPETTLFSGVGGLQVQTSPTFSFHLGVGLLLYRNELDRAWWPVIELGFSFPRPRPG